MQISARNAVLKERIYWENTQASPAVLHVEISVEVGDPVALTLTSRVLHARGRRVRGGRLKGGTSIEK